MTKRNYDPAFEAVIPMLPVESDFSTPEKVQAMREARGELFNAGAADRDDVSKEDRSVPGPAGAPDVPVRIYRPRASADGLRPGVFEIHGGGFVMGSIEMMDPWCQTIAGDLGTIVVSVEYRLAPENPFPAGVEDCYAALSWMAGNASGLEIDPARIAISGQSAGGGLAAGTALMARDRGGPELRFQVLEIPELDDRLDTPSMRQFTDTPLWNRPNAVWSWRHYLGADHEGEVSPSGVGATTWAPTMRERSLPMRRQLVPATSRGCRRPTSRPWSSIRFVTRASSLPCACSRPAYRSNCTRSREPSTARRWWRTPRFPAAAAGKSRTPSDARWNDTR